MVRIPSVTSPFTIYQQIVIKKRQQRRKKGPRKARLITLVANQQKHFEPSIRILTERKLPSFNGGTEKREKKLLKQILSCILSVNRDEDPNYRLM